MEGVCGEADGLAGGLHLFGEAAWEIASILYTDLEQGGNTNVVVRRDPITAT